VGKSIAFSEQALSGADAVIIVTDHSDIDYRRVKELAKVLVDTRAAVKRVQRQSERATAIAT
jgi:UDP-N-acetyl-D-glucosamine dehydrogenase